MQTDLSVDYVKFFWQEFRKYKNYWNENGLQSAPLQDCAYLAVNACWAKWSAPNYLHKSRLQNCDPPLPDPQQGAPPEERAFLILNGHYVLPSDQ